MGMLDVLGNALRKVFWIIGVLRLLYKEVETVGWLEPGQSRHRIRMAGWCRDAGCYASWVVACRTGTGGHCCLQTKRQLESGARSGLQREPGQIFVSCFVVLLGSLIC